MINPPKYYYLGSGILKRRAKDRRNRKYSATKREEIMFNQFMILKLLLNCWLPDILRLITPSPGGYYKQGFTIKIFFIWLKAHLPSLEIRGVEQMGRATCFSAFKELAVEEAQQVGWKCHLSPEALVNIRKEDNTNHPAHSSQSHSLFQQALNINDHFIRRGRNGSGRRAAHPRGLCWIFDSGTFHNFSLPFLFLLPLWESSAWR